MGEIARFYGLVIRMFDDEHDRPHFHVRYAEFRASILIDPLSLDRGRLPPRAFRLVMEWAAEHQKELMENWELMRQEQPPNKIQPLR